MQRVSGGREEAVSSVEVTGFVGWITSAVAYGARCSLPAASLCRAETND
jgi:hypothetical protein